MTPPQASCGITFTLLLTSTGIVYACGSSEHGQLGNGKTGERIVTGGKLAWDLQEVPSEWRRAVGPGGDGPDGRVEG